MEQIRTEQNDGLIGSGWMETEEQSGMYPNRTNRNRSDWIGTEGEQNRIDDRNRSDGNGRDPIRTDSDRSNRTEWIVNGMKRIESERKQSDRNLEPIGTERIETEEI